MILSACQKIDHILSERCEECFEQPKWLDIMIAGGAHFGDSDRVTWVMNAIHHGLSVKSAPLVYQTLFSAVLNHPHPIESDQVLLLYGSPIRIAVEHTRADTLRWLRKNWVEVRRKRSFEWLEDWALKEISDREKSKLTTTTILTNMVIHRN